MDDRNANRQSGIPRLSKLPIPRPSSIRPSPSRESLSSNVDLRSSRLRSVPSREQLPNVGIRRSETIGTLPATSRDLPRSQAGPVTSANSSQLRKQTKDQRPRAPSISAAPTARSNVSTDGTSKKPLTLSKRPSQQFSRSVFASPTFESVFESPDNDPLPSVDPEDEAITFDTIRSRSSKPRPSLSERTIETLSQLPSSPAVKGRASASFFDPEGRRPSSRASGSSRPGSSYQSEISFGTQSRSLSRPGSRSRPSSHSRPGSSSGLDESSYSAFRASTNTFKKPLTPIHDTPNTRKSIRSLQAPATRATPSRTIRPSTKLQTPSSQRPTRSRTPSPEKKIEDVSISRFGAKTMAARPPKSRSSLNGLFKKPSLPAIDRSADITPYRSSLAFQKSSVASDEDVNPLGASTASTGTALTVDSAGVTATSSKTKSSAALRDQIAKAKAAKRAATHQASASMPSEGDAKAAVIPSDTTFDFGGFGLQDDPFNVRKDEKASQKVLQQRIEGARTSGRLNIPALGLKEIPTSVLKMYDLENIGGQGGSWAESVDLTRFVAADNELETIDDAVFPDRDPQDMADDEEGVGNIFGGLETLDLHGNTLIAVPLGLRRLQLLTSLNLSQNQLANNCLEVISQVTSLRDLKLANNLLYGPMDSCFSALENLQILDLRGNNIEALPVGLENLSRLRILNLSENSFESLPFDILSKLPLTELQVRKNKICGSLIDDDVESMPNLQTLDVSCNQLRYIVSPGRTASFPQLHTLSVSANRLRELPNLASWSGLLSLAADENSISSFPEGFTSLDKLKHVDLSNNDIRVVPQEIGRMEHLAMLLLSGNPLRDKKFSSITTDELKATLLQRMEPETPGSSADSPPVGAPLADTADGTTVSIATSEHGIASASSAAVEDLDADDRSDIDDFATPPTSAPVSPARSRSQTLANQTWPVKNGLLDRSGTQSSTLHPVVCSKVASDHRVREVQLHHNLFTSLPDSLTFFADSLTALSVTHNQLVGESYLNDTLELPALKELNLSANHITGLTALTTHLRAPCLEKLDVSLNRIASLPPNLRAIFPCLAVLLLSNNHLIELEPETIKGMRVVDAGNNDIAHLNPKIGLLGGNGGLQRLEVTGNRFRVPRWNVLERGTEATLRWLRGRVPVAEMAAWRDDNSVAGGGGGGGGGDEDADPAETSMADLD